MTGNILIEPERLASAIERRFAETRAEIIAYWMQVTGDREIYAQRLRDSLAGFPIVVFVVRDVSFNNPNAVLGDLINALNQNRSTCEEVLSATNSESRFGIVLISRTRLSIPQISSPVTLPQWFPRRGGETVFSLIEDLTWSAECPINSQEVRIEEVCDALFACEGLMLRRLKAAHAANHNSGNAFMEIIRIGEGERYSALLADFETYRESVTFPSAFRPSLREGSSLIARLWRIVQNATSDGLNSPCKALAAALGLPDNIDASWREGFMAVISRPSNRDGIASRRFARSILMTISSSCQFVTAAAHAGEYEHYPVPLLVSFSYELRRSLIESENVLARFSA